MTPEEELLHEIRKHHGPLHMGAVAAMLDALVDALDADMEQGAAWMNDAAHSEFKRKYPRFTTLLSVARHVDWESV